MFEIKNAVIGNVVFVESLASLPAAVLGVITLEADTAYFIAGNIDLGGARIATSGSATIFGSSSETCSLTSTGLVGSPLIDSIYTLALQNITIKDVPIGVNVTGGASVALDWSFVNFLNVPNASNINGCGNFVFTKGALLNAKGFIFSGTIGTISFNTSLFSYSSAGIVLQLTSTAVITRRFRVMYSAFAVDTSTTAIDVNASATIPDESYILDNVNFGGSTTYLTGVTATSNKALFDRCKGIVNTSVNGQLYMNANATPTPIAVANTFYKVLGTTSASADNSKYLHSNNRLTNDAAIERKFLIQATVSFSGNSNNVYRFGFYDSKLGGIRVPSRASSTANTGGRAENITFSCAVSHKQGDYLEVWVENTTGANAVTVTDLNFIITEIG